MSGDTEQNNILENKPLKEKNKKIFFSRSDIVTVVIGISLALLIRIFVFDTAIVEGASMEKTIFDGERVGFYKLESPQKGDIVIIDTKANTLIKRVVATEGDRLKIVDGKLFLNEKQIKEEFIKEEQNPMENMEEILVPKGEIFAMGDNRNNSTDSRAYGTFSVKENYKGKVKVKFSIRELDFRFYKE
jgi:signal peptidase I